jgi:hypothetical protein
MEKLYSIKESTLKGLANAVRSVNGETARYSPDEMIEKVTTIMDSITYILVDENGVEVPAVFVENETIFTAEADDIRLGKVAANQNGVVEGTKEIPTYQATSGSVTIKPGKAMTIPVFSDLCQYTELQVIVCDYNTAPADSVSAEKVVINDTVYNVGSTIAISVVAVDPSAQTIKLGFTNENETSSIIRYMIIKEE